MIIYPAIDIKDGKCVRLTQGRFAEVEQYSDNIIEVGQKWEKLGAEYLHVVDLDGARLGELQNIGLISELTQSIKLPIQLGGGIRSLKAIELALNKGIERVILGTSVINNPQMVEEAVKEFADRVVVGIDAKDGLVAIEGWEQTSKIAAIELAKRMEQIGMQTIIYTDIARDGMLQGPNFKALETMVRSVEIEVIASGGVSKLVDIRRLKDTGVSGAIIGKALYTGNIDLQEAIEEAKG